MEASSIKFFAHCWVDSEDYWDVYYFVVENVFNEFKRNNISIPYNQIEIRERKDNVVMPVIGTSLVTKEAKVRNKKQKVDLENADLLAIFNSKKKEKKTKKTNNAKELEKITKEDK